MSAQEIEIELLEMASYGRNESEPDVFNALIIRLKPLVSENVFLHILDEVEYVISENKP